MNKVYICARARTPVLVSPQTSSQLETELLYGQSFVARRIMGAFIEGDVVALIESKSDFISKGFVRARDLIEAPDVASFKISALKAPVFARKDIKSSIKMVLPFGARLRVLSAHRDFVRIGRGQYVHRKHIIAIDSYEVDFVDIAERHLGLPYIWGGLSSDGLDCSGLVQTALWATGQGCPRNSGEQQAELGRAIDRDAKLMRGDLVFWAGHVGIMQDDTQILHANGYHMCVETEPLKSAARRIEKSTGPIKAIKRL